LDISAWACADPGISSIRQLMIGTHAQKVAKLELQTLARNICS